VKAADPLTGRLANALAGPGYGVEPGFVTMPAVRQLVASLRARDAAGLFHAAGIGVGSGLTVRPDIRGDRICWLDGPEGAAERGVYASFETLRVALNRTLMLGLTDLQLHYALYPPGAGYQRHLDRSPRGIERVVTVIVYLNEDWDAADGGELVMATATGERLFMPTAGPLVVFLSAGFEHEVRAARRERLSLTGWFSRSSPGAMRL
jgi:SM-20-related protein